ncbi:MAG: hypothetical protein ACXQTP_06765 [Candidatus Methanofastidiosia archaeon]
MKLKFVAILLGVLMLSAVFQDAISARPGSGFLPPPKNTPKNEDFLILYREYTFELGHYLYLRKEALDTKNALSLDRRLELLEDMLESSAKISHLSLKIEILSKQKEFAETFDATTKKSKDNILNNLSYEREYNNIVKTILPTSDTLGSSVARINRFLENEKTEILLLAKSIYKKDVALGGTQKKIDDSTLVPFFILKQVGSIALTPEMYKIYLEYNYWKTRAYFGDSCASLKISGLEEKFRVLVTGAQATDRDPLFTLPPTGGIPDVDSDGDGLEDLTELEIGTSIWKIDSDGDGLSDYEEVRIWKTNPLKKDTDEDLLDDYKEIRMKTNPLVKDTDGDGKIDGLDEKPLNGMENNPFYTPDQDSDNDGLSDAFELKIGTNMFLQDTDKDGLTDYEEVMLSLNPLLKDTDDDGATDLEDHEPLNPNVGKSGIDKDDDEEVLMIIYGIVAVGTTIASFYGCSECPEIAIDAINNIVELYLKEMEERENGTDE